MSAASRLSWLRLALVVAGLACLSLYPLMRIWPSGWAWHEGYSDYPLMIVGVYATLGVFLLRAARDPLAHWSLIWFAVWSSIVHAAIMAGQALARPEHHGHLWGDIPALLLIAVVLAVLLVRATRRDAP